MEGESPEDSPYSLFVAPYPRTTGHVFISDPASIGRTIPRPNRPIGIKRFNKNNEEYTNGNSNFEQNAWGWHSVHCT